LTRIKGLDRIDQPDLPLNGRYSYPCVSDKDAEKVQIIVVDTGIDITQPEFETQRATWGVNLVPGAPDTDDEGHGTFASALIGGTTFGVFKNAQLIAVKVCTISTLCDL
jgi:subtilisin family serine protease